MLSYWVIYHCNSSADYYAGGEGKLHTLVCARSSKAFSYDIVLAYLDDVLSFQKGAAERVFLISLYFCENDG